jgi:hypothetical protein
VSASSCQPAPCSTTTEGAVQLCQSTAECLQPGFWCGPSLPTSGGDIVMVCDPPGEAGTAVEGGQGEGAADGASATDAPVEDASPGDTSPGDAVPSDAPLPNDADGGADSQTLDENRDAPGE